MKSAHDLSVINGQLLSYSFHDGQRGWHNYLVQLAEYPTAFKIPADFLDCFQKSTFQSDMKSGDMLWVSVPKECEKSLNSDGRLFVFSIRTTSTTYLDERDTIKEYNSDFPLMMSVLFFLIGAALIMWRPRETPDFYK